MSTIEAPVAQEPQPTEATGSAGRRELVERIPRYGTIGLLILAVIIFSLLQPDAFFTTDTLINILEQSAVLVVVACGLTTAMVMFEFDLSIASMASLAGVLVTGFQSFDGAGWPLAVLETIAVASAIGLVSGAIVALLKVNSFIVTLAMGTIVVGINLWYNAGQTISLGIDPGFVALGRGKVAGIPNLVLIALGVAFLVWLLLSQTTTGRNMYAIGGNREAARLAGLPIARTRMLAFVISAALAALGGIMLSARSGSGFPTAGDALLLQAFTACFLGSVTLRDGEFHVVGTVVGVLLLSTIFTGLTIVGVADYVQDWVTGALLIFAVASSGIVHRLLGARS